MGDARPRDGRLIRHCCPNQQIRLRHALQNEAEVRAKLDAIRHIVDYYCGVNGAEKPALPAGTVIDPLRQPRSLKETVIREAICFHLSCDVVGVSTLHDAYSLLEEASPTDRAYLAVILPCASMLRQQPDGFRTVYR